MLPGAVVEIGRASRRVIAVESVTPAGRESVNPTTVSELPALGLVNVKVRDEVWLTRIGVGLNDVARLGADGEFTVRVALEVFPLPPWLELTWLVVLVLAPAVVPVTVMAN